MRRREDRERDGEREAPPFPWLEGAVLLLVLAFVVWLLVTR